MSAKPLTSNEKLHLTENISCFHSKALQKQNSGWEWEALIMDYGGALAIILGHLVVTSSDKAPTSVLSHNKTGEKLKCRPRF